MPRKRDNSVGGTGERIAKAMARAGLCSRREAEAWIVAGRVAVNGAVIASPALDVGADDRITVDGAPLPGRERTRLFLYHKPRGLLTTHADPQGRPTIFDSLPKHLPRLLSVGRLDLNTEGLLLLTNDGGLARVLELPATGWLRRYRVRAHGSVQEDALARLRTGITIDGVHYGSIDASLDRPQGSNVWLTFAMREGKNREVKNVLGHLGLKVNRLIRVSFGPFQLGELAAGDVAEVPTRVLREQIGEKVAHAAGADFSGPKVERLLETQPQQRHPAARAGSGEPRRGATQDAGPASRPTHKARAPQDHVKKVRASKTRRREAERLGEPALARRERRGAKPHRKKR
jgi:23S rRNA pseudouridine2605 synthase